MKRLILIAVLAVMAGTFAYTAVQRARMKHPRSGKEITVPGPDGSGALLFNGWKITPAGRSIPAEDMILSGQVSPDGKHFAFTNSGYGRHMLHIVDLSSEKKIAAFPLDRAWSGLAWAPDGKRIFVSGGVSNVTADVIVFFKWDESGWTEGRRGVSLLGADKEKTTVSSLAVSKDGSAIYALNASDNHLYILDINSGRGLARMQVGAHPIASTLSADGATLYVANLGGAEVVAVDVRDPVKPAITGKMATDAHPNDVVLTKDGRLFVSCGNANTVLAYDLKTGKKMETIYTSLSPKAPAGSTPNSLAVSPDGEFLYVANADNNNIAVIEIEERGESSVVGFIPTGWYPTLVRTTPDGKRLLAGTGKGMGTGPNFVQRPIDKEAPGSFHHMGNNLAGMLSFIDAPNKAKLAEYTKQVYANTPYRDTMLEKSEFTGKSVIPTRVGQGSPIKHVLYILKENRTYDQVLGDLPQGNGDPSLLLFGRDVTPNQHALAEQFVLLDNLYCSGEVSQDGHPWSTSAYATEFTQRHWVLGYSGHGRPATSRAAAEQTSPYIWEQAEKAGLSVRAYGYGGRRGLENKQSELFDRRVAPDQAARARDYVRADRFVEEFLQMEKEGKVPNFMMMSLGENHTSGTRPGAFTPKAQVASNDVGVGKIVEVISKSSLWDKFAIFIIEDDAQNGPDHIDSHRTTGFVISPYIKRKHVDSTMYTTVSMLRTIELLLGLPPLTQYDAAATPMFESFSDKPDMSTYTGLPARIDLMAKNAANAYGARESAMMNFDKYDDVDEDLMNRILWHSIKGAHVAMPAPVRRAIPGPGGLVMFAAD
jgi:DNA-binding beta-propeller fold protein YncE